MKVTQGLKRVFLSKNEPLLCGSIKKQRAGCLGAERWGNLLESGSRSCWWLRVPLNPEIQAWEGHHIPTRRAQHCCRLTIAVGSGKDKKDSESWRLLSWRPSVYPRAKHFPLVSHCKNCQWMSSGWRWLSCFKSKWQISLHYILFSWWMRITVSHVAWFIILIVFLKAKHCLPAEFCESQCVWIWIASYSNEIIRIHRFLITWFNNASWINLTGTSFLASLPSLDNPASVISQGIFRKF